MLRTIGLPEAPIWEWLKQTSKQAIGTTKKCEKY